MNANKKYQRKNAFQCLTRLDIRQKDLLQCQNLIAKLLCANNVNKNAKNRNYLMNSGQRRIYVGLTIGARKNVLLNTFIRIYLYETQQITNSS